MKIALVSPYDLSVSGGVNSHILPLAAHFRARGHDVRVIGPASTDAVLPPDPGIEVIGRPRPIPTSGSIARIAISLRVSGKVKEILARERFDIVHVHEPLMPFLPIMFLRHSETVNVGTFHAAKDGGNRLYAYSKRLLRRWFRKLDGKVAVSPAAERLVSRYFPGYYNIIPNGIDVERFTGAKPLSQFMDGKLNVLFVGRMEKRKGLKYLLRAFIAVKQEMPDARLIVVGDGRLREGFERRMAKAGIEDVIFAGRVPDDDLPRYYASADIFCAPNTGNESQGYVLLEAMASGKPVIASNIEGFATVITDGVEGHLVLPKDSSSLALALVHLLADSSLRREMGRRARLRAEEYGWDRVAQRVLSYYERLLYERGLNQQSRARRTEDTAPVHVGV
jgi:phosphatidyl-myo-inositol alpha-mannosyltransferase